MLKFFVIAGNHDQFSEWRRRNATEMLLNGQIEKIQDLVHVSSVSQVRGIQNPKGMFIGTWYQRHDIGDILMQLQLAGVKYEKINEIMLARQRHLQLT